MATANARLKTPSEGQWPAGAIGTPPQVTQEVSQGEKGLKEGAGKQQMRGLGPWGEAGGEGFSGSNVMH